MCSSQLEGFNYYKAGAKKDPINKEGDQEPLQCNLGECSDQLNLDDISNNKDNILFKFKKEDTKQTIQSIVDKYSSIAQKEKKEYLFPLTNADKAHSWNLISDTGDLFFGNVTYKLKDGFIKFYQDGSWEIEANLAVWDDYYDFNKAKRGFILEGLTGIGRKTKGRNYSVPIRGKAKKIHFKSPGKKK